MKTAIRLGIIGIVALVAALIYTVPAHFVISKLPPYPAIQIAGINGTFWNGSAAQVVLDQLSLGRVEWNASPFSLITTRLTTRFKFQQNDMNGNGTAKIGKDSVTFEKTSVFARSDALQPMLVQLIPSMAYTGTQLSGQFNLDLETLDIHHDGPRDLQGVLLWQGAGFQEPMPLSLGNVNAKLGYEEDQAIANLDNANGELDIRGSARMKQGWYYSTNILVSMNQDTPESIANTLPLLGQTDRNGAVRLQNSGVWQVQF